METYFFRSIALGQSGWVIQLLPKSQWEEVFSKKNEPIREVFDLQKQARIIVATRKEG